jgi:hypothetical protein
MIVRHYYDKNGKATAVDVKPKRVQWKCNHEWRDRIRSETRYRWTLVCKNCGLATAADIRRDRHGND